MGGAVLNTQTPTKSAFPISPEDFLVSANRAKSANTFPWSPTHDLVHSPEENWHLSKETTAARRASTGLSKLAFPSNMPSRATPPHNNSASADMTYDRGIAGSRWLLNGTGQLVDSEAASAEWDLADEIATLKISGVGDHGDDGHGQIRTPPQTKVSAGVVQLNETSPLETSSDTSIDSSSPHQSEHQINISHSRGSSTDTTVSSTHESVLSSTSHTLRAPSHSPLKVNTGETKERPHSFSGGLSSADLRRLQQAGEGTNIHAGDLQHQQWSSAQYRETIGPNDKQFPPDQPIYPSLANQGHSRQQQQYDYIPSQNSNAGTQSEDLQIDYNIQPRNFNSLPQGQGASTPDPVPQYIANRPANIHPNLPYRQLPRGFAPPQGMPLSPSSMGYPGGHTSHLSLGNTQQLYDMMLPPHPHETHPAVARVQQQHNVFRAGHQHSASDPSAIRDAATLALLNSNLQNFAPPGPGMFPPTMAPAPPMSMYANQYYGAQEAYPRADVAAAQAMAAARLQSQYTGPYGVMPGQGLGMEVPVGSSAMSSGPASPSGNGPSANNRKLGLYKTELCRSWEEKGTCRYGTKCQFAHGEEELRKVARHPKYKTEICRTFWVSGSCPYGKRCCFIHTELPATGTAPGADGIPPPQVDGHGRARSDSDPDASISLLARIKRQDNVVSNSSTPVEITPSPNGFQYSTRPPSGSLRVDTSALDNGVMKQNKSAYPTFASNGLLLPNPDQGSIKSPAPVTAGPDLGRHNNSRVDIVGYNQQQQQQRLNKTTSTNPNLRHSFNGTDVNLNFSSPANSVPNASPSFTISPAEPKPSVNNVPRANGHVRSGSAGNWGSFSRSSHLAAPSPYPQPSSPGGEAKANSPWSTSELAVGSSRLNESNWV